MKKEKDLQSPVEKKLDIIIGLLQSQLALELAASGMTHEQIGKRLHVAKATVGEMLRGLKREK